MRIRDIWAVAAVISGLALGTTGASQASPISVTDLMVATNGPSMPTPTAPTTDAADVDQDPANTYSFKCCGGAAVAIDDLEVTYAANVTGGTLNSPVADMCIGSFAGATSTADCKMIAVGDILTFSVDPAAATFVSACWTGEVCVTNAVPVPEPPTAGLVGAVIVGFLGYNWLRRRLTSEALGSKSGTYEAPPIQV